MKRLSGWAIMMSLLVLLFGVILHINDYGLYINYQLIVMVVVMIELFVILWLEKPFTKSLKGTGVGEK
jgi:hypothetical protein